MTHGEHTALEVLRLRNKGKLAALLVKSKDSAVDEIGYKVSM